MLEVADLSPVLSHPTHPARQKLRERVYELSEEGLTAREIAEELAKGKPNLRKRIQGRIYWMLDHDPIFQEMIGRRAHGNLVLALGATTTAVGKRAGRGRPVEAKLLMEATGFHNPRVKHEHTGDIKITIEVPRPAFDHVDAITDAQVVDGS